MTVGGDPPLQGCPECFTWEKGGVFMPESPLDDEALLAVSLFGLLAACTTPEQTAKEEHATCRSYGFSVGTQAYGNCRLALAQIRAQEEANRRAAFATMAPLTLLAA